MPQIIYELTNVTASLPQAMTAGSAGYDVFACLNDPSVAKIWRHGVEWKLTGELVLMPGDRALIPLGFKAQLPAGYEAQVRPRSGLAIKKGITVANSPGTIDCDYPDEWMVGLINLSEEDFTVRHGDRIAQIVIAKVEPPIEWCAGTVDRTTERAGGFGSTGKA
jgi:dUTP pyrophosphatase